MAVSVREVRGRNQDRAWLERQLRDYYEDLGALNTGHFPALPEYGHNEPNQLQSWLSDPQFTLLTIVDDQQPAGFALIAHKPAGTRGIDYRMTEFFVARDVRRRGLGRSAARLILDRFAGNWEILEYQHNPAAVAFWRRTIAHYTKGRYTERVANGEVRQMFTSGVASAPRA